MNPNDKSDANVYHQDSLSKLQKPRQTFKDAVKEWVRVIVLALIIAIPIRHFIAEPFIVNGASMDPTFSTGQFLIVDRLTYRFSQPERGDVVIFKFPYSPKSILGLSDVYYIKRIIGLPGERVRISNGVVSIQASSTETILEESYVSLVHKSRDNGIFPDNGKVLGPTEYFVMGDNRLESSDSRAWGPLDASFITGRPLVRLSPLSAISVFPGKTNETSAQ